MTLAGVGAWTFFMLALLFAVYEDIRLKTIPNVSYALLLVGVPFAFHGLSMRAIGVRVVFAFIIGITLLIAAAISKQLGGGDVKLIACMMLYFEPMPNMFALIFSCALGLLFCEVFRVIKKARLISFAFAPFLSAGYLLVFISKIWR